MWIDANPNTSKQSLNEVARDLRVTCKIITQNSVCKLKYRQVQK